jgi:hypothetical protein
MLNREFAKYIEELPLLMERLLASRPLSAKEISAVRKPGIYCFSEGGQALYLGRTKDFSKRYKNHCSESSGENTAAFAFILARKSTDREKPTYGKIGSRKDLIKDPVFLTAFQHAKQRIRNMEVRFVEIDDPNLQHLFELYASIELNSTFNKFLTT